MPERPSRDRAASLADAELVAAMRREDAAAIAELYRRFAPLLRRRAASWCNSAAERDELVDDVLGDVALTLMRPTAAVPRSLAAYLLVALRHRAAAARSAELRRRELESEAADDGDRIGATAGATDGVAPLQPVLARLAAQLEGGLGDADRLLLVWLADHVPMRTVAGWLGIGYDAALKRASRLRARLRAQAIAHADSLPPGERQVVYRFLGRARGSGPDSTGGDAPSTESTRSRETGS